MKTTEKNKIGKREEIVFLVVALAIPLIQFFIFYFLVNFNSILLSFKSYTDTGDYVFAGINNFKDVINDMIYETRTQDMLKNSFIMYFFTSLCMMLLTILVSYSIWKKTYFSKFFSIMLFLPSVLPSIVFVVIGRFSITTLIPEIFGDPTLGEILNPPKGFFTVIGYQCLLGFGSNMIYFLGAMSNVSSEIVESGQLEGVNAFQEFWHIVFPQVYSTMTSLLVVGIANIFTAYGLLISFYETSAAYSVRTIGYNIFVSVYGSVNYYDYPYFAALGLIFTVVIIPIVLLLRTTLEKIGPRED